MSGLRPPATAQSANGNIPSANIPCQYEIPWYVIHTCCHHEVKVAERLLKKGLEVFLPRHIVASRRRDRKKLLSVPLFPGYLFIQDYLESALYYDILNLPGVVRFLAFENRLQPVPPETIDSIRLTLAADRPLWPYRCLQKGRRVRVVEGLLTGVIGIRETKASKRKIVIEVKMFNRALAVELEDDAVEPWS